MGFWKTGAGEPGQPGGPNPPGVFGVQVGVVLLALLVGWPPVHMVLAHWSRFSPWRYGGFGMYSAPDASDREVHVLLSWCEPSASPLGVAKSAGGRSLGFYYRVARGTLTPLSLPSLDPDEERALAVVVKQIRSLSRPGDFERLGNWVDARFGRDQAPVWIAILVTEPHLDPRMSVAYSEAFGFVREGGVWSRLGHMRASAAMRAATERGVACP